MTTDGSQEFCLRWNNHQATIISVFDYLLENETLVDCTLAAEGQYLKAHKVVLCACSPYLELLLSQHNDKHPILIFKDIKFNELKSMIDYMYKGEVNIAQDQLNHFLKAAESLQIKGLSESEDDATPQTATPTPRPPPPRAPPAQRTQPRPFNNAVAIRSTGPSDVDPDSPKRIIGRPEAQSPTPRKRRRQAPVPGRPSLSGDDASNASEGHFDQSNCDVPTPAHSTSTSLVPSGDSEKAVAKVETNSELMLEPKTEYDDNSVEDITLDDDDEDYSQAGTSQMDNSQGNFGNWQQMVGDQTGDDVFSGQDTGAQNSQELERIEGYCRGRGLYVYEDHLFRYKRTIKSVKYYYCNMTGCKSSISAVPNGRVRLLNPHSHDPDRVLVDMLRFKEALREAGRVASPSRPLKEIYDELLQRFPSTCKEYGYAAAENLLKRGRAQNKPSGHIIKKTKTLPKQSTQRKESMKTITLPKQSIHREEPIKTIGIGHVIKNTTTLPKQSIQREESIKTIGIGHVIKNTTTLPKQSIQREESIKTVGSGHVIKKTTLPKQSIHKEESIRTISLPIQSIHRKESTRTITLPIQSILEDESIKTIRSGHIILKKMTTLPKQSIHREESIKTISILDLI